MMDGGYEFERIGKYKKAAERVQSLSNLVFFVFPADIWNTG